MFKTILLPLLLVALLDIALICLLGLDSKHEGHGVLLICATFAFTPISYWLRYKIYDFFESAECSFDFSDLMPSKSNDTRK